MCVCVCVGGGGGGGGGLWSDRVKLCISDTILSLIIGATITEPEPRPGTEGWADYAANNNGSSQPILIPDRLMLTNDGEAQHETAPFAEPITIVVVDASVSTYREVSNIRRTKSQNLNASRLVLKLSLPNPLKPGVKLRMKMWLEQRRQAMLQLHLSDQQCNCLLKCVLY